MTQRTCTTDGCEKPVKGRGLCGNHYYRASRDGTLDQLPRRFTPATGVCSVDACGLDAAIKGMCRRHYRNLYNYGHAVPLKEWSLESRISRTGWTAVQQREGMTACQEWNGSRNDYGYGEIRFKGRLLKVHRVMFEAEVRPLADDEVARHRCDNPPCMNPEHLEAGTKADNTNDMVERDRTGRQYENTDWECTNGHDVSAPGAYKLVTQQGRKPYRTCVTCARTRAREYARRRRARLAGQA